jgi:hypothetical protein
MTPSREKGPALRRGLLDPRLPNLLFLAALAALLLARPIALTRILVLLSGFLTTALLLPGLLTWALLARVLTLLIRILVLLLRHSGNSLVGRQRRDNGRHPFWLPGTRFLGTREPKREMISVQAGLPRSGRLQRPVPSCYKTR